MTTSFQEHFSTLKDPRIDRKKLHDLMDIIVLAVCAVASGADGWEAIEDFGKDASRIRKGNGSAIMTSIRHLCMNLFEKERSKLSLAKKRRKAAWNDTYRAKVIFSRPF